MSIRKACSPHYSSNKRGVSAIQAVMELAHTKLKAAKVEKAAA